MLESAKISQELADFDQKIDFWLRHFPCTDFDVLRVIRQLNPNDFLWKNRFFDILRS